ncbi:signal recognition particle-docking protein FtsY [Romboutsia sp. CE17]|uniref:signal recognition particle-docking protein FtsY n=1 Tax=Romboutsia sp. CE17 TaxID=2724150 RepID=UPI001442C783|nr:signal recognition particle-docking protein FtsY [Romboutsia sp. CE17]QJA09145.1 signal recognition particle-docking protein FtsY [Romboutsia sp. CE17]
MFKKLFKFNKKKQEEVKEIEESIEKQDKEEVEVEQVHNEVDNNEESEHVITEELQEDTIDEVCEAIKEEAIEEVKDDIKNIETKEEIDEAKEVIEESEYKEELEEVKEAIEEIGSEEVSYIENDDKYEDIKEVDQELVEEVKEKKVNLFDRLKQGLTKAKQGITDKIDTVLKSYTKVDEELLEDLEEVLITADVGVNTTMDIIERLRDVIKSKKITDPKDVRSELQLIVEEILTSDNSKLDVEHSPTIILMVGVNGVGKTTTIGKLANRYKSEGKKVLLAAGDTFRAAAIEQLEVWANRSNVDIIKHQEGADPGAVIFDAIKAAKARNVDLLICDTAGRLHNKANLMNELGKVFKIVDREFPEAKREVLLVVDATTGQNAVSQAKTFKQVADITGIVLTKLDGTAKGGVVLAVKSEVDVPVKLIGVGESVEDLQDFDAKAFSDALFGNN